MVVSGVSFMRGDANDVVVDGAPSPTVPVDTPKTLEKCGILCVKQQLDLPENVRLLWKTPLSNVYSTMEMRYMCHLIEDLLLVRMKPCLPG